MIKKWRESKAGRLPLGRWRLALAPILAVGLSPSADVALGKVPCQNVKFQSSGFVDTRRAEQRVRLLIELVNAFIPVAVRPPELDVKLIPTDSVAMASYGGASWMAVPSRYFNHLDPQAPPIKMSLRDSDAVIAHEYGHLVFRRVLFQWGNPEVAALHKKFDAAVETLNRISELQTAMSSRTLMKDLGLEAEWAAASEELVAASKDPETRVDPRSFWDETPSAAAATPAGQRVARAMERYKAVLERVSTRQSELEAGPEGQELQRLQRKQQEAHADFATGLELFGPFHELFADLVGVLRSRDAGVIARILRRFGLGRDFGGTLDQEAWHHTDPHTMFGPVRSFMGRELLPRFLHGGDRAQLVERAIRAMMRAINATATADPKLRTSSVADRNQALIKALSEEFNAP